LNLRALQFYCIAKTNSPESWWGDINDIRLFLDEFIPNKNCGKILDISCGPGFIAKFHLEKYLANTFCCDISMAKLSICKKRFLIPNVMQANSLKLPIQDQSMDLILLIHSFPGWDYPLPEDTKNEANQRNQVVAEAYRILKKKGVLIASTPNREFPRYWSANKGSHQDLINLISAKFKNMKTFGWNMSGFQMLRSRNNLIFRFLSKIFDFQLFCRLMLGKSPRSLIETVDKKIRKSRSLVCIAFK